MSWTTLIAPCVATLAVLWLPGLVVAVASRTPWRLALAVAPALSVAVIAVSGIVTGGLGVRWGLVGLAMTDLGVALIAAVVTAMTLRGSRGWVRTVATRTGDGAWYTVCLLAACVALVALTGRMLGAPGAISQTFDANFHLNAVRWIVETGEASSLTMQMTTLPAFYPLAWHQIAALMLDLGVTTSVPVATNALIMVTAAVVWPVGVLALTRTLTQRRSAILIAAVTSAMSPAFPYLLVSYGVLYPNLLGIALLPEAILLLVVVSDRLEHLRPTARVVPVLLVVTAVGGVALAHPNAMLTWLVFLAIVVLLALYRAWRDRLLARSRVIVSVILLILVGAIWVVGRPPMDWGAWPPFESAAQALGEAATGAPVGLAMRWLPAVLALVGTARALRSARWMPIGLLFLVDAALYAVDASMSHNPVRYWFVGGWYSDSHRLAALLPLAQVPLAGLGASRVVDALVPRLRVVSGCIHNLSRSAATCIAIMGSVTLLLIGGLAPGMRHAIDDLGRTYVMSSSSEVVSDDELALMERVPSEIEPGASVVVSPDSGGPLLYALTGVDTTFKHVNYMHTHGAEVILNDLKSVTRDPEVCSVLESLDARYVLYFPGHQIFGRELPDGFIGLPTAKGFTLVDRQGEARLYEVTACSFSDGGK